MRRRKIGQLLVALTVLTMVIALIGTPPLKAASGPDGQPEATPPALGAVIVEDPLTAPGIDRAGGCPTGRNETAFVGEGFMMKVTGKCRDTSTTASISSRLDGLQVPDGEIRTEYKLVTGQQRAEVRVWFRDQGSPGDGYFVRLLPSAGQASFVKFVGNQETVVSERGGLTDLLREDWNTLAVRARGSDFWLLLNDQAVLAGTAGELTSGGVILALYRQGSTDDSDETAMVWRNLRISALDGSEQARLPTYSPPAAAAPAPSGDPWVGEIRFGYDPGGSDSVPAGGSLKIHEGRIYAFFGWRNLPPGVPLKIALLFNDLGQGEQDYTPRNPSTGQLRLGLVNFLGASEGGGYYTLTSITVIFSSGGRELARGSLGLSQ